MNKLNKDVKNSLNLVWLIVTIICIIITYYCMKAKATNNYKEILYTATENCNIEVIRLVVKNMIDINNIEAPDFTILHNAANVGCLEVIKFLLDEGANIHVIGKYGGTALHNATYKGHLEIVRFLLERGANPNIKDGNGKTPRTVAVARSRHNKDKSYDKIISLLYNAEEQMQFGVVKP